MSLSIVWMPEAEQTLDQNIVYLTMEWNSKVMNQFLDKLADALKKISKNPLAYPLQISSKNVRKYNLNKRIALYYRVVDDSIELLLFWNASRNPKDLKF